MKYLLTLLIFCTSLTYANELTLYFVPSPYGMDWTSPQSITLSALKNRLSLEKRYIGHAFVELKCGGKTELTGMTGKNFDPMAQLFLEGRGLGILYHSFEGELETSDSIQPELNELLKEGKASFVRFLLNEKQCQRATQYLSEYRSHNVGRHYGLANRPRYAEGAGCSAFAVSFPEVLDILDYEMQTRWSYTIRIPEELAGPPLRDETVGILKVIMKGRWADHKEKSHTLSFWSPDKMDAWVREKVKLRNTHFEIAKIEKSEGLVIDRRKFPIPEGPIWLQHTDPKIQKPYQGQ